MAVLLRHGRRGRPTQQLDGALRTYSQDRLEISAMDLRLQGKRTLVTGRSIGLGEAIARALAAEGVAVAIHERHRNVHTPLRQASRPTAVGSLLSLVTLQSKVRHRSRLSPDVAELAELIFQRPRSVKRERLHHSMR